MVTRGLTFEEHRVGAVYTTAGRTVSETDIVTFVNLCGFTEPIFLDMEYVARESLFKRRAAPGALTFALSEGLIIQTGLLHGTGMAFLGGETRIVAPVLEGDTITVEVEVADKRETRKADRGIVTYQHRVRNQRGEVVLEARVQRMIRRSGA
jgi:acyl dehydratase